MTVDREALRRAATAAVGREPLHPRQRDQVNDAVALVERVLQTWPIRDPIGWVEEVVLLDLARAETARMRLRREHTTTPTYGAFFEVYRARDTHQARFDERPGCSRCEGSGWVEAPSFVSHDHEYPGSMPCPSCADGAARERTPTWQERQR